MQKPLYIIQQQQLSKLCLYYEQQLKSGDLTALFLDTEFIRQSTYYPKLALVQITDGHKLALIDPLAVKDLSPFFDLCFNPNIIKVFHSGSQDLEIFYHLCQQIPKPIFDTQIAAAMLGTGMQIGYAPLVKELLDIDLDKSQTRTNWLHRPLSQAQIDYAGNDVIYLEKIFQSQYKTLKQLNRLAWLDEEFIPLSDNSTYAVDKDSLWKKVKGHQRLKPQQLKILQDIAKIREELAIKKDKVRRHVISDDALIQIAQSQPQTTEQLFNISQFPKHFAAQSADSILNQIKISQSSNKSEHPQLPKRKKLEQQQDENSKSLIQLGEKIAFEQSISANFLFQRKEIERIILNHSSPSPDFSSRLFSGWRKTIIGQPIQDYLNKL